MSGWTADLLGLLPEGRVSLSQADRQANARDCWTPGFLDRDGEQASTAPEAVVWPRSTEEVARVLAWARGRGVPVVPYGGGSGVCGAAIALKGGISLDLKRMDRVRRIHAEAGWVEAEAGILGVRLEEALNGAGLSLGHFPSSIHMATLGGYIATRSSGQCSTRYGSIEDMILGLEGVLPDGTVFRTPAVPRSAAGPAVYELLLGSEGTLGVVTAAVLSARALPEARCFSAWRFPDLDAGVDGLRRVLRADLRPAVARLYDPLDTALSAKGRDPGESGRRTGVAGRLKSFMPKTLLPGLLDGLKGRLLRHPSWIRRAEGWLAGPSLMVLVFEGPGGVAAAECEEAGARLREAGGQDAGEQPARHWFEHRYEVNFKQPGLYAEGLWVDTMEVAATWDRLLPVYHAVRQALGDLCLVLAHFSHAYPAGCSIYFTLVGSGSGRAGIQKHRQVWDRGLAAASEQGATIGHHHGVGLVRAGHLAAEMGPWHQALAAVKDHLDPGHLLNPGKLGLTVPCDAPAAPPSAETQP